MEAISGDRWHVIAGLVPSDATSVLDIGCRDRGLKTHLPAGIEYVGLDLNPPADVIASAEERLPFDDRSFEVAVLADVLEHLDDPHGALDEAIRVARRAVVILLPNIFTLFVRIYFNLGRMPSGKYAFGPTSTRDRHRWILNFDQAAAFAHGRAEDHNWVVAREYAYLPPFRRRLPRLAYRAARLVGSPNLWSWEYVARIEPTESRLLSAANSAGEPKSSPAERQP